jgi:hypothetical protein
MRKLTVLALLTGLAALGTLPAVPAGVTPSGANEQITFARQIPTGGANVFIANPDGSDAHQVPLVYPAEDFGLPIWSPDRSQLLISHVLRFDASGNLLPFRPATVGTDGANFKLLEPPNAPDSMGCFGGWYPDGTRLLCGFGDKVPGVFSIRASDGGDPVRLTSYPFGTSCNACDEPTDVSSDGRRFVFLRYKNENAGHQQVALFVKKLDGTGLRQLTPYGLAEPHEFGAAQWSPDGREIISETTQGAAVCRSPRRHGPHPDPSPDWHHPVLRLRARLVAGRHADRVLHVHPRSGGHLHGECRRLQPGPGHEHAGGRERPRLGTTPHRAIASVTTRSADGHAVAAASVSRVRRTWARSARAWSTCVRGCRGRTAPRRTGAASLPGSPRSTSGGNPGSAPSTPLSPPSAGR